MVRRGTVKKGRRKKVNNAVDRLSKSDKKHLYEFGELHPIVEDKLRVGGVIQNSKLATSGGKSAVAGRYTTSLQLDRSGTNKKSEAVDYDETLSSSCDSDNNNVYGSLIASLNVPVRKKLVSKRKISEVKASTASKVRRMARGAIKIENSHIEIRSSPVAISNEDISNEKEDSLCSSNENIATTSAEEEEIQSNDSDSQSDDDDTVADEEIQSNDSDSQSDDDDTVADCLLDKDPYKAHFDKELTETDIEKLQSAKNGSERTIKNDWLEASSFWPTAVSVNDIAFSNFNISNLRQLTVKQRLAERWGTTNRKFLTVDRILSPLQEELFQLMNLYRDVLYANRTFDNAAQIRNIYCLHALNHVLKIRHNVLKNNARLLQAQKEGKESGEYRDQGFTRPKVLILVPFREAAKRVIETCISLLLDPEQGQVTNKKRFYNEFGDDVEKPKINRSDDYWKLFAGNTDDHFRIGINITRKVIKLYAPFYNSDIIIASPLGLRTIIGAEGDKKRDYDFLSSIDILIADQVDVLLIQNWDHVLHILQHMNCQPKESHDTDFSRVRLWTLSGWSAKYRQNLFFTSFNTAEIQAAFSRVFQNYDGKIKCGVVTNVEGRMCQVALQVPQVFHKIDCDSISCVSDRKFAFFKAEILPRYRADHSRILIYVSSYFDFIRMKNYFKQEEINFDCISESTTASRIPRIRALFSDGRTSVLLYSERFHFFRRYKIRGAKHVIFYGVPTYPTFYPEIVNMIETDGNVYKATIAGTTCTVLYTKYDVYQLRRIVGTRRCQQLLSSTKNTHMFTT